MGWIKKKQGKNYVILFKVYLMFFKCKIIKTDTFSKDKYKLPEKI